MNNIHRFHIGQTVIAPSNSAFTHLATQAALPLDTPFTVTEIEPDGFNGGHVTVEREGRSVRLGHLVFEPVAVAVERATATEARPVDFKVGDRVRVTDARTQIGGEPIGSGRSVYVGREGVVVVVGVTMSTSLRSGYYVLLDGSVETTRWSHDALDLIEATSTRPLVHFDNVLAERDRSKAREAAGLAISRTLDDEHNEIFRKATDGGSVDAYDLNEAVLAAMRSASTRWGQSMQRRDATRQFAHLGHIVQAVLEKHADTALMDADEARADTLLRLENAEALLENTKAEAESLVKRNETLNATVDAQAVKIRHTQERLDRAEEIEDTLRTNLSQTIREANEYEATLRYALEFLSESDAAHVRGFQRGFVEGARQD